MSKTIHRLTDLECKHPAKTWLNDGNGLWLRCGADGRPTKSELKTWISYSVVGKKALGTYPQLGVAAARKAHEKRIQQIRDGLDPMAEKLAAVGCPRAHAGQRNGAGRVTDRNG